MSKFKFGDRLLNEYAGEGNPHKVCTYISEYRRTGRLNPGKFAKVLFDDGRTGDYKLDGDYLKKIGNIIDDRDALIAELVDALHGICKINSPQNASIEFNEALMKGVNVLTKAREQK